MSSPPFNKLSSIFKIGISPIDHSNWLELDAQRDHFLEQKARLNETRFDDVFCAERDTEESQQEVLDLVRGWLRDHANIEIADDTGDSPPLLKAASLIQEDLVIMRRGEDGWRLVAASVCFPSRWGLREKFGRPMHEIHSPVPGFGADTRNNALINRMFDNFADDAPVERLNWSIVGDDKLPHWPNSRADRKHEFDNGFFVRAERQTLRKLPESGDILFTIRIHVDALPKLRNRPDGPEIAASLAAGIRELDEAELRYKSIAQSKQAILEALEGARRG